jgi:prepilin signal peptidase PulO-like enzyme (type II secretory pathway)
MVVIALILLGLGLGSFVNALVWRICEQDKPAKERKAGKKELSIIKGRSMCTDCGHTLYAKDLVPVFSWLNSYGRCRYCHKRIHWQYPLVELATAASFVFSYLYWPYDLNGWSVVLFGLWLAILTGLMALFVYDVRWMLLPNRIMWPLFGLTGLYLLVESIFVESNAQVIIMALAGSLIGGGIFYVLFQISKGRWIGGGDVKLGLLIGLLLGSPLLAMLFLFLSSLVGTLVTAPLMASRKIPHHARVPFGPFLIVGGFITYLFGQQIIDWYLRIVGL